MDKLPTIYQFRVKSLEGKWIDFSEFKGKKILIVNTASRCGFTPQYAQLQELSQQHKNDLVVVGFPANNFGGQEPGTNDEIRDFCENNYQISFPMAAKVSVKGDDMEPIFNWLTKKKENGVTDVNIKWNFTKFLINEKGEFEASFESHVAPFSEQITERL